jgi:ribose 5-phosphate isomerase A
MNQDSKKQQAAAAALAYVTAGSIIGVGTGSTVNFFIDGLAAMPVGVAGAVSSSDASTQRLEAHGIQVLDLNSTGELDLYVDGADEATRQLHLIKGGGAALTREKIVAAASRRFVCIVDDRKWSSASDASHSPSRSSRWRAPTSPGSSRDSAASPPGAQAS